MLEHAIFLIATVLIGFGAALSTRARVAGAHRVQSSGEILYVVGIASLLPLWGAVFLVAAESLRVLWVMPREGAGKPCLPASDPLVAGQAQNSWAAALRREADRWGIFLSMIAFSITLVDRLADVLLAASVLVWAILNLPSRQ